MFTINKWAKDCRLTKRSAAVLLIMFLSLTSLNAQDVLIGLTSNGGPEGGGTAFSIKSTGADFSIIKGFADWGKAPNGDLLADTDGSFYGMTNINGTYNGGAIFKMSSTGTITILKQFNSAADGASPYGELIKGTDGNFYGMTGAGGPNSYGTIFSLTPAGVYTVLRSFSYASDGSNPKGHLVKAKDGNFYGITYGGGANGYGTIFKITTGGVFTVLRSLNKATDGANSYGSLSEGKDGNLYGVTNSGGIYGYGTIFKISTAGAFTVIRHLNASTDGSYSQCDLVQATDAYFYGTCYSGGTYGNGTIFKIAPNGTFAVIKHFISNTDGALPYGGLVQNSDGNLYGMNRSGGANNAGTIYKITTNGAYTVIHAMADATEGSAACGSLVKAADGNLYGMASSGGAFGGGTAFKITTGGALTVLANFNGPAQGNIPLETLVKGKDSAYYGTNSSGGAYGWGTIFKICGGATTTLYAMNKGVDGGIPKGSLLLASDGNFYGMNSDGGPKGYGNIFKITPAGKYSVLYNFNPSLDGGSPQGSLIQATDGSLYGLTISGGAKAGGTAFKITLAGTYTVLHHFDYATEGNNPEGNLLQASDGNFYGMTSNNAHIFQITSAGTFSLMRALVSSTDGYMPLCSLIQKPDGFLYGTTNIGGLYNGGTIFRMSTTGTFTVLKHFNPTTDGKWPKGNILVGTDGNFYGLTSAGGTNNLGTIFRLTTSGSYTVLRHFNMATDGGTPNGSLIIAPVSNLIANTQSLSLAEDTKKTITLTGSGGSPLSFNILSAPANGKLTGTGANKTYVPNTNYNGTDLFTFNVSVGCIASAPATINLSVTPVADSPVLAAIGNKSIIVNNTLTFTATAKDADKGQKLSYSILGAPAGAAIDAKTGVFTYTPTTTGNYTFKVRVTDNDTPALYDEETITVSVTAVFAATQQLESPTKNRLSATLYPNPVENSFYLSFTVPVQQFTLLITDMNGIVLKTGNYNANGKTKAEIVASGLKPGAYIAQIKTLKENVALKFIKK